LLKLHQIYFRKFISLFILLFIIVGSIVYIWLKDIYIQQVEKSLLDEIKLLALHVKDGAKLDMLANEVKKDLDTRVTIIDKNGKVLAESHKDKTKMDNHRYRKEIISASENSFGEIIRYSKTLDRDLLYVAKKFNINGKILYIRMAKEIKEINDKLLSLALRVFVVLVLFFAMAFFTAYKLSKDLQNEIKKIMKFLFDLTKKNKNSYIISHFSKEFYEITRQLTKISKILTKKDRQKAKYTSKLKKANEQKDDIISAISHEFKNPIAVINGYSQTLLEESDLNVKIREKFLSKIESNGKKLSLLIDKLRLSIKLDEKKLKPNFIEIDVVCICQHVIEDIGQNYKNRDIVLKREIEKLYIEADATLFEVALSNLIENALKYSEDEVEVFISKNMISIKDRGIGISKKEIEKITRKFYRVNSNGWNNSLGLGLSIVSNILKLHGFTLQIESREEKGSVFSILF